MTDIALKIAQEAFKTKVDKAGKPYFLHCERVMNSIIFNSPL